MKSGVSMTKYVSLLRGINVGGHRMVRMYDLKELYTSLGFSDVLSYIQSGNVIFTGDGEEGTALQKHLEEGFETSFGFHTDIFVRTLAELSAISAKNPFRDQPNKEAKSIAVVFLATCPEPLAQEALLNAYAGSEEIFILGQEVYIYYPDGMGRSKLSHSLLEKKLRTVGTARNWNTVLKLQALLLSNF